jgi:arylsulfatase A-like enzyme
VPAAWEIRLHQDLAHGTLWLAAERAAPAILAGGVAGLLMAAGLERLLTALSRRLTTGQRAGRVASGILALLLALPAIFYLRSCVLSLLPWSSGRLTVAALTVMGLMAAVMVATRLLDRGRSPGNGPLAGFRRCLGFGGMALLAVAAMAWLALPLAAGFRAQDRSSVILVSLDTLRADRLGSMGYPRPTTPILDQLAAEGTVMEKGISPAPWTLPAHVSLFTSQLPDEHRVRRVESRVRPYHLLLSESFREAGYRTAAFTGGGYVSGGYGFRQGFEVYDDHDEAAEGGPEGIAEAAVAWVRENGHRPFFLFLHTYEPHGPYTDTDFVDPADRGRLTEEMIAGKVSSVPDPTEAERRYISDLYDGDIAHTDRAMGGALATLKDEGFLDKAIVVVTSDHGEDFWDHDATDIPRHGHTLYEEIVHVPLFLRAPGIIPAGGRLATPVSLVDLGPTLLDLTGLPVPASMHGISFETDLRAGTEPAIHPVLSEAIRYGPRRFAWREGDLKVILTPEPAAVDEHSWIVPQPVEVFDLARDPRERINLSGMPPEGTDEAVGELTRRAAGLAAGEEPEPGGEELSDELREQLRSLGYID